MSVVGRTILTGQRSWVTWRAVVFIGLVRASVVPPAQIRELRGLTRYRKALIHERTRHANRPQDGRRHRHQARLGGQPLAPPAERCWRRWWAGTGDPDAVPTSRAGGSARSCRPSARPWPGRFRPHSSSGGIAELMIHAWLGRDEP